MGMNVRTMGGLAIAMAVVLGVSAAGLVGSTAMAVPGAGSSKAVSPDPLIGTWMVDLRPGPDAPAYLRPMTIEAIDDARGKLTGTFYRDDCRMEHGYVNVVWGAVHFGFVTADNSGRYVTQGVMRGDKVSGTTLAIEKGFLSVWEGVRAE